MRVVSREHSADNLFNAGLEGSISNSSLGFEDLSVWADCKCILFSLRTPILP
jgi:hypothetical protein